MSIFCIDVGGTETKYATIEKDSMIGKGKCVTLNSDTEQFLSFLEKLWKLYGEGCKGIAISMPGLIDSEKGYVNNAGGVLRQIRKTPFASQLERITNVPVSVENDARCAALAELSAGALQGCKTAAALILGTGIGGALIQNGRLYRGSHLFAGEFSYVHTNQDAFDRKESVLAVRCGGKEFREKAAVRLHKAVDEVNGYVIFELAESGNQEMLAVIKDYATQIARFIYNLQCIYDPEKIVIGGGISARTLLIENIQQEVNSIYEHDIFGLPHAVVVGSRFHNDANLIGAYYRFLELYK